MNEISVELIEKFRELVEQNMLNDGATSDEIALVTDVAIINAIRQNRSPKDVAWAFLQ